MKSLFKLLFFEDLFAPGTIWQDKYDPDFKIEIIKTNIYTENDVKVRYLSDETTCVLHSGTVTSFYKPI